MIHNSITQEVQATVYRTMVWVHEKGFSLAELLPPITRLPAPRAEECISYGMPAFRLNGKLIAGFKAATNHCSFYPMSGDTVASLAADLSGYETSRGTIRFTARAGLPATLVRKLVKARIAER